MTRYTDRLGTGSEELLGSPAILANSVPGLCLHKVDQLSRATEYRVRTESGLTKCPGRLGPE